MAFTAQSEKAATLAARLQASQTRKGTGIPYIAHLLGVSRIAVDYGATEEEAIALVVSEIERLAARTVARGDAGA